MNAPPPRRRRALRLAAGCLLSAAAVAWVFSRVPLGDVATSLSGLTWGWLPWLAAVKVAGIVVKDRRWRRVLAAMRPGQYRRTFSALCLGYFTSLLLPLRLGELARVELIRRHNPELKFGDAIATVAAERVLDLVVLASLATGCSLLVEVPPWMRAGVPLLALLALALLMVLGIEPLHRWARGILPPTGRLSFARRSIEALSLGTAVLRRPRPLGVCALWTVLAWTCEAAALWCACQAVGLDLTPAGALVVTLLLVLGLTLPSAPAQVGTHQALLVLLLAPFGAASEVAVAASLAQQAVTVTVLGALGGAVLMRESASSLPTAKAPSEDASRPPPEQG